MLRPDPNDAIPEETQRVSRAAFPKGNIYITLRDELGSIYGDEQFAELFPAKGQPAESPGRLGLVTVMQFLEGLSDRQAADAVRSRIDWKYFLGLSLEDPGFHYSVLSEFRTRLIAGSKEAELLRVLLEALKQRGMLKGRGRQRTDSTHIEAAIRSLNRIERVGETLRMALNSIALVAPGWIQGRVPVDWYERYKDRFEDYRLPSETSQREALTIQMGKDGRELLNWVYEAQAPEALRTLEAVQLLRRMWIQEYYQEGQSISLRAPDNMPSSERKMDSPFDPEARYSKKRDTTWVGYKDHLTETCDEHHPHLIIHVETTRATLPDNQITERIHQGLQAASLLPEEHVVDVGYLDAMLLVNSQAQFGVRLIGPALPDSSWQKKAGQGFDLSNFRIDWEKQQVTCPQQHRSHRWIDGRDHTGNAVVKVEFDRSDCLACPTRASCTRAKTNGRRLTIRSRLAHEALLTLRQQQGTLPFCAIYRKRAGIEGTISQAVRRCDLRHARYLGLAKTHLQNICTAVAINLVRFFNWLQDFPLATSRTSHFYALAPTSP